MPPTVGAVVVFGLVHGAWHRGWHWHLLVAELAGRGYQSIAVDLPTEEADAGADRYADVVLDALAGYADVVLVAHSLGGLTAAVVARRRPVRELVLVAPLLPEPELSWDAVARREGDLLQRGLGRGQVAGPGGSSSWLPERAVERLYPDVSGDLAAEAARRLRPQYWRISGEVTPLAEWPAVPTRVVVCADDLVVTPDALRRVVRQRAESVGTARLPAELVELAGGHSPFLARPAELADLLIGDR